MRAGRPADHGVLARPDLRRPALLPRSRHRRHHQPELRRRVDCAAADAVRLRHRARLDVARRGARAGAAAARSRRRQPGRRSPSTGRAGRRASRSPARSGWRARPAIRCCRSTSKRAAPGRPPAGIATQIPKPLATVSVVDRRADVRRRAPTSAMVEAKTRELERALGGLEVRARAVASREDAMLLIASIAFGAHVTPPGHPERHRAGGSVRPGRGAIGARAAATLARRRRRRARRCCACTPEDHVAAIAATAGRRVDARSPTRSPRRRRPRSRSWPPARRSTAVEHALHDTRAGVALVRPPGHHAERDRAMGFCLYNNVAVAAAHALRARPGAGGDRRHRRASRQRHAVDLLRRPARPLRVQPPVPVLSRAPAPPSEVGPGAGAGFTVNMPLEAGATDADYAAGLRRDRAAGARAVRARAGDRLGRLRRARARPAGVDAGHDRGLRRARAPRCGRWSGGARAGRW